MKLMNDYLDEDIKFDEELHRDDDSLKSYDSTSSLDINNDAIKAPTDNPYIKSLFKPNISKVITNLNIIKPNNNNIEKHLSPLSPIKNNDINVMLASLSQSFDDEKNTNSEIISHNKSDNAFVSLVGTIDGLISDTNAKLNDTKYANKTVDTKYDNETILVDANAVKMSIYNEINDSINAHKSEENIVVAETINSDINGIKMPPFVEINETINAHKSEENIVMIDNI
jgi:hypothetical protein